MNLQLNSQFIIFIQVLIAVGFVIWIMSRRGSTPKPTVLNMTNDKTATKISSASDSASHQAFQAAPQGTSKYKSKTFEESFSIDEKIVKAKNLNVIFMWNGHSWDAYEVFGLPAGSPVDRVREKFNELKSASDEGQVLFLAEALKAIENKTAAS